MLLRLVSFSALVCLALGQSCPGGWVEFGDSCYYLLSTDMDWFGADKYCSLYDPKTYAIHLVSIESEEEQNFLAEYAKAAGPAEVGYWTSGNNIDTRLGWTWAGTASPMSYFNWAPGEPSGDGSCAQLWADSGYRWDDTDCVFAFDVGAICEVKKADVPFIERFQQ